MRIKDVMTKNVTTVTPEDTIETVAKLMQQYDVGSIPVCEGQNVVGIITDRDIVLRCVSNGADCKRLVKDYMTKNPVTTDPSMEISNAVNMMSEKQIRRLPVVENNCISGMVALGDLAVAPDSKDEAGNALSNISFPSKNSMS